MVAQQNISKLSDDKIQRIKEVEDELGVKLLAYETSPFADLSGDKLRRVQDLEKELGVTLLAYR